MKATTKKAKVLGWAQNQPKRNIGHAKRELGYSDDRSFFNFLNGKVAGGYIKYVTIGRTVYLQAR